MKNKELFSDIDCYITRTIDPGLIIIEGKPAEGVTMEAAEVAIWEELELLKNEKLNKRKTAGFSPTMAYWGITGGASADGVACASHLHAAAQKTEGRRTSRRGSLYTAVT